jgi:glutathione S-transferase
MNAVSTSPSLKLYTLPPAFGLRNVSPFCLKIEMLMTSLGVEFDTGEEGNPQKAPKGKLPFLVADGRKIADSELIAQYLDEVTGGAVFARYDAAQLASGTAITRLVEDHLYWILVASRWLDDDWWPNVVKGFFSDFPLPVRAILPQVARRGVRKTYHLHGLGRHTLDEQRGFASRDLAALCEATRSSPALNAKDPGIFDFTLAGFMSGVYDQSPATWVNEIADEFPDLKQYTEDVQKSVGVWGRHV